MDNSATLSVLASDFLAKGITIKNLYNLQFWRQRRVFDVARKPAVAVKVYGDRSAFFDCTFQGVQDTLFDDLGRHFFQKCAIEGGVDFIFGNGQSIYQQCTIQFTPGAENYTGYITAQGRERIQQTSGFVFNACSIVGTGQTYLGRAYRHFSRVIIANSYLSNVVYPIGWFARSYQGQEARLTYVEEGNVGPGADTSKRVSWMKHMDPSELSQFLSIKIVDNEGWIYRLPN